MMGPYPTGPQETFSTTARRSAGGGRGMEDSASDAPVDPMAGLGAAHYWGDGRGVLRRPEARSSILEDSYVIHSHEESKSLSEAVFESVTRRGRLSDTELAAGRQRLFDLARRNGVSLDDTH